MNYKNNSGINVLSLFDGISCGMLALDELGINVNRYDAYEIDENAIKVSKFNYPSINHCGDVFNATYKENEYDLLIGGSPCTYWSIAQTKNRETTSSRLGWELFKQYVRALKQCKPKYFLYENNFSISKEIKDEISKALCVEPIMINSALLCAQNRKREYWTNIPNVIIPDDRYIYLCDVIDFSLENFRPVGKWVNTKWGNKKKIEMLKTVSSLKSHTLTTSGLHSMAYYLNEDKTQYCNLTINDWEKLQTLPIGYVDKVPINKCAKYKAIGNGWTIEVIKHILSNMIF